MKMIAATRSTWPGSHLQAHQRGIVAIEFALLWIAGVLPLLLITLTGVMVFSAKQTLSLAAEDGARAMLTYQPSIDGRRSYACSIAEQNMLWLRNFAGLGDVCASLGTEATSATGIAITEPVSCPGAVQAGVTAPQCVSVTATYNYNASPFLPGTSKLFGWAIADNLQSTATVQLDTGL
ncbi:TadE/TadG family type IV pilus assembly protein [Frateuria aurantia]